MKTYQEMTLAERQAEYAALCRTHQEQKALGLDLNMARGKPGREQLDMVMEMYNIPLTADDFITDASMPGTMAMWQVFPLPGGCLRIFWAASPARSSLEATPPWR